VVTTVGLSFCRLLDGRVVDHDISFRRPLRTLAVSMALEFG
jgi:hypothetical protein